MHRHMSLFRSPIASDQGNTRYQHGAHPGLARWCHGTMTGTNNTLLNCAKQSSWLAADGTLFGWPPEDDIRSVAALPLRPGHGTVLRHRYSVTAQCYGTVLRHSVTARVHSWMLLHCTRTHADSCFPVDSHQQTLRRTNQALHVAWYKASQVLHASWSQCRAAFARACRQR